MPEKSVTRSFRITESAFSALEEEAKKRNMSLNTLVNQLFLSFANFDRHFQRIGFIKTSKVTWKKVLELIPDKQIVELGTEVAQESSRIVILARQGKLSLTNVIDYLKSLADYGYSFEYNEVHSPGGRPIITLIHSLGEKGSVFYVAYAKALFDLIDMEPKLSSTKNSVTIEL